MELMAENSQLPVPTLHQLEGRMPLYLTVVEDKSGQAEPLLATKDQRIIRLVVEELMWRLAEEPPRRESEILKWIESRPAAGAEGSHA